MELYILSKQDLNILSICKLADYQINLDEETNAKSTFTLIKTNGLKKENYMVLNGLYRQFIFVIDDVQTEKESDVVTVTALDISNVFNRKVIEKNIDTMKSKSIEEFLANTISENFVNSDDTALNVNYIEIYWHTNTQGNVATNAENGLYNFHIFLTNCRQYKNIYTDFKLENLGNPQTVEGKRISIEAKNRKIVDISLNGESTQNGTPTPDNPIEIENVEGKNKFNKSNMTEATWDNGKTNTVTLLEDGRIQSTANYAQWAAKCIDIPNLKANTNYVVSGKIVSSTAGKAKITVKGYKNNTLSNIIYRQYAVGTKFELSFNSSDYEKIGISLSGNNSTLETIYTTIFDEIQLEEGTIATSYVPYNSLEIKDIGENLFDKKTNTILTWLTAAEITEEGSVCSKNFIPTTKNKIYATNFAACVFYYDKKLNYLGNSMDLRTDSGKSYTTWTNPDNNNIAFMKVEYRKSFSNNLDMTTQEIMLTESGIVKPYKLYQEQKIDFPLSEGQKLYEGSYLADDGIHHKRKQYVITGNETIEKIWIDDDTHHVFAIKASLPVPQISDKTYKEYLCNTYRVLNYDGGIDSIWANRKDNNTNYTTAMAIDYANSSLSLRGRIIIKDMSIDDIDKMKTYLSEQHSNGTPVIVEYGLSEEEIVPYTEAQQEAWDKLQNLMLYEGINHISSNANMVLSYYPLNPIGIKLILRIDIENKVEETKLIDTTLPEVTDYNKIYEEDVTAKVQVYIREDGSEYNLYLKTDRTTTTNKDDPNRLSGKIEVISVDTADKAAEEALNVMKGNRYKHLVEFKIAKTSKLMDITQLYIRKTS